MHASRRVSLEQCEVRGPSLTVCFARGSICRQKNVRKRQSLASFEWKVTYRRPGYVLPVREPIEASLD